MLKRLIANLLDQAILMGGSWLLFLLVQAILKVVGFKIVMIEAAVLIIYAILNVLYYPILEGKGTIGKRIFKLN